MTQILHITTHMGGGVGKALSGLLSCWKMRGQNQHSLVLLEPPEKQQFIKLCEEQGISVLVAPPREVLNEAIMQADIVELEWWHHPVMARLLLEFPAIPMRLVIWSHISGCSYPWIPYVFLSVPHKFIFTSAYSYENPYWSVEERKWAQNHVAMINSSGGFSDAEPKHVPHEGFCAGYVGTLSYAKLHPDFTAYCSAANSAVPDISFRLVGDAENAPNIRNNAARFEIADKFSFAGYTEDVASEFAKMDVFTYLLNPTHFGTTENVLLEAMNAEVPVIILNQCAEKFLVRDRETGLLVQNQNEFAEAVRYLYEHPEERRRLGKNARAYVRSHFLVKHTADKLNAVYRDVLQLPKRTIDFSTLGKSPQEMFLQFLTPVLAKQFIENHGIARFVDWSEILRGQNKSSLRQFARNFPEVQEFHDWILQMEEAN